MSSHLEVCICAAVRMPDGYIVRGHRHADAIRTAAGYQRYAENWECPFGENGEDQGFVTSLERYVTREEGYALQRAAGRNSVAPGGYRGETLFSEDLY